LRAGSIVLVSWSKFNGKIDLLLAGARCDLTVIQQIDGRAPQVDEGVANLKALASIYRQKTGQLPTMFGDLDLEGSATYQPSFSDIAIS
jgi:hypothetical protein